MKAVSTKSWPKIAPQPSLIIQKEAIKEQPKGRNNETGIIRLSLPTPPDEKKIKELNALASQHPFCILYKPKKHDPL